MLLLRPFLNINLFIFSCVGSSLLHAGFLQLRRGGLLFVLVRGLLIVVASLVEHGLQVCGLQYLWHVGFSICGMWAQQLWRTGLVALQHVGSSQTRARTRVPCIGFSTTAPPGESLLRFLLVVQQAFWSPQAIIKFLYIHKEGLPFQDCLSMNPP